MDITTVKALFGRAFKLLAVYDAFSRMPLAASLFEREPSSDEATAVLSQTFSRFGWPRHVVTDHGSQFTASTFACSLAVLRITHRLGAVGKSGSIALIERFWRTIKAPFATVLSRPLTIEDTEQRLGHALVYYAYFRPHSALDGATPAEVFFGEEPAHLRAVHPPRGRRAESGPSCPFRIGFLDPEARFPILVKAA